jgi:hypothetical protein
MSSSNLQPLLPIPLKSVKLSLSKKQGTPMQLSEIKIGDKIEASGLTAGNNTIYQTNSIRDLSVYPKKGTFTGIITALNILQNQFTIYNKTSGNQTIHLTPLTTFTQTTQTASSNDLKPGMTATVKGLWERTATDITATQISAKFRYINIELTGTILWKSETGFTIATTTGTLYGINFTAAKLQNKNNQPIQPNEFNVGDTIKIQGKHLAENPQITATTIKNTSK